jgi:hypothetical protein
VFAVTGQRVPDQFDGQPLIITHRLLAAAATRQRNCAAERIV